MKEEIDFLYEQLAEINELACECFAEDGGFEMAMRKIVQLSNKNVLLVKLAKKITKK